jgi:LysM repeat protein
MSRPLAAFLALPLIGATFAVGFAAFSNGPAGRCGSDYRVHRGDTLYSIARRCGTSVGAIARASRLRDPRRIAVGQRLVIPGGRHAAAPHHRADDGGGHGLVYRMAPQDTLFSLARWSRVSLPALMAANPGINPHKIEIGDPIRLPGGAVAPDAMRARERGVAMPGHRPAQAMPDHHGRSPHPGFSREDGDKPDADEDDSDRDGDFEHENDREREPEGM